METSLIQPNSYHTGNSETSFALYNLFINQSKQLQNVWGYRQVNETILTNTPIYARFTTLNQKLIILADGDGIVVTTFDGENFKSISRKFYFRDVRDSKYDNGKDYIINPDGFSIKDNGFGIMFITDGSISGLYVMFIPYDIDGNPLVDKIIFKQFNFSAVQFSLDGNFIIPYQDNKLVACVKPSNLEYFNTHICVVDDNPQTNGLYVIDNLQVNADETDFDYGSKIDGVRMTRRFIIQSKNCALVKTLVNNSILFVIGTTVIEKYYADTGELPIGRYQDTAREVGCIYRNLAISFNGKLIFIGSSDDKKFILNVWEGGDSPREVQANNLSEIFQDIEMRGMDYSKITMSAFGSHSQEFVIINGLYKSVSVMIEISTGNSCFIKHPNGFPADDIFKYQNRYFFTSKKNRYIYEFSNQITSFDGKAIDCSIRTMQIKSGGNPNHIFKIKNLNIVMATLPEDKNNLQDIKGLSYIHDKSKTNIKLYSRSKSNNWSECGINFQPIANDYSSLRYKPTVAVGQRVQLLIEFKQKIYTNSITGNDEYSKVLIDSLSCDII